MVAVVSSSLGPTAHPTMEGLDRATPQESLGNGHMGSPLVGARGVSLGQSPKHGYSGLCENPIPKRVLQVKGADPVLTDSTRQGWCASNKVPTE